MLARLSKRARSTLAPLVGVVALATVAALATPAGARTPAGLDTAAPSVRAAMAQQLHDHPGGTVISRDSIAYDNGNVVVTYPTSPAGTVTPALPSNCGPGWLCLYEEDGWHGTKWQFRDEGVGQNLAPWGATPFYSFYNHRSHRWFLHRGANLTGAEACYPANASVSTMSPNWAFSKSIYLGTSNNPC